jgi:hypothetical protein
MTASALLRCATGRRAPLVGAKIDAAISRVIEHSEFITGPEVEPHKFQTMSLTRANSLRSRRTTTFRSRSFLTILWRWLFKRFSLLHEVRKDMTFGVFSGPAR